MDKIDICKLGLSTRSTNALKRAGIITVEQLLKLRDDDINNIKNMGEKSVTEVLNIINKVEKKEIIISESGKFAIESENSQGLEEDFLINRAHNKKNICINSIAYVLNNQRVSDIDINNMMLSNRSYNTLAKNNIFYLSDICKMTMIELCKIKYLGQKCVDEIIDKIREYTVIDDSIASFPFDQCCSALLSKFETPEYLDDIRNIEINIKRVLSTKAVSEPIDLYETNPEKYITQLIQLIKEDDYFLNLFKVHLLKKMSEKNYSTIRDFADIFPAELIVFQADVLQYLLDKKNIEYDEGYYTIVYPSFKEYVFSLPNGREKVFLMKKVEGATLEEIGEEFNITKERVRQVISKTLSNHPQLKEDKFIWLMEKYSLNKDQVVHIFDLDEYSYEYYCIILKKFGTMDYLIINEEDVPIFIKRNLETYRYKDCIDVDGEKIEKERDSILHYILRTKCREEVTEFQVKEYYNQFLIDYELTDKSEFQYPKRYFETKLASSRDVLWKHGKKLRYYVISDDDFNELLKDIHFDELSDVEISTRYFVRNYPDIMDLYDINDEYELHNLLKKHMDSSNIDFNRMPHIGIGNYDRNMQVLDLLIESAPIRYEELGKLYEERYGVEAKTAMSVHFSCISEYIHNGVYNIDYDELTKQEYDTLSDIITEDIHELAWIKTRFKEALPDADLTKLNNYNFKKLGYKISVNLIYNVAKYKNMENCVKTAVLNTDIIDLNSYRWMMQNQVVYSTITKMQNCFDIVEFSKLKYIRIEKLQEQEIRKQDLLDFCISACEFVNGRYFTVHSILKNGFTHKLLELGFDDYFYISLLRNYTECSHTRLGSRINSLFCENKTANICDFIQTVIYQNGSMDIFDLLDYLNYEYGIVTEKYKLVSWIRESELYYSETMEKVYLNYDQFFEEV